MKIEKLSIKQIQEGLKSKGFSCVELVQGYLDKIEELNAEYNVFTDVCGEYALEKAKKVDEKIAVGEELGILEGVPYSVKNAIATRVGKSQAGSNILKDYNSVFDATVVERLDQAGAIMLGKTNCDSFGHGSSTRNSDYGVTKNPFNKDYVAGGSSGGAAASVALGMCCFAIGEDTGGSIRQPASFCGVYGLKPSYGRVSRYGAIAYGSSLDTIGPMGNNVEDIGVVLGVIAGRDEKDATTYEGKVASTKYQVASGKGENDKFQMTNDERGEEKVSSIKYQVPSGEREMKKKIAVIKEFMGEGLDGRVRKLFEEALEKYNNNGWEVVEYNVPVIKYSLAAYYIIACSESSSNLSRFDGVKYGPRAEAKSLEEMYVLTRSQGFSFETKKRIILGTYSLSAGYADKYYKKAAVARAKIKDEFEKILSEADVILLPTSPVLPMKIVEENMDPMAEYLADIYTVAPSLAGLCGLNVPIGMADGLPVGMQVVGGVLEDGKALRLGEIFNF